MYPNKGDNMDKIYFNQNIDCNVLNCIHCNQTEEKCLLSKIKINSKSKKTTKEKETFCESFESYD